VEYGSHAAARKHGLRTPHADAWAPPSISVFDPVHARANGFSDSFLGVCSGIFALEIKKRYIS
jgi:hypothetical protein